MPETAIALETFRVVKNLVTSGDTSSEFDWRFEGGSTSPLRLEPCFPKEKYSPVRILFRIEPLYAPELTVIKKFDTVIGSLSP